MLYMRIVEVTTQYKKKYIGQIASLEQKILNMMEQNGQVGQFFTTGEEDIEKYVDSSKNTVLVSVNDEENVDAATYITQGQSFFSYNDITKYFKSLPQSRAYIRSLYANESDYKMAALEAYKIKLQAYSSAKKRILKEHPQFSSMYDFLQSEVQSENRFDEKSILREKLSTYMYEYVEEQEKLGVKGALECYERFYYTTVSYIKKLIYGDRAKSVNNNEAYELETILKLEEEQELEILQEKSKLVINESPVFSIGKYIEANPQNSIEIDTYLTDPTMRCKGKARALVYEGIKKHMERFFKDEKNKVLFLCSTLHRDNVSSKYVSEFFGLKDSLYVKRREGRNREVHIVRIDRANYKNYLNEMAEKLAVLYDYNPQNLNIPLQIQKQIVDEQRKYEMQEFHRLNGIRHNKKCYRGYKSNVPIMNQKLKKIRELERKMEMLNEER